MFPDPGCAERALGEKEEKRRGYASMRNPVAFLAVPPGFEPGFSP
jgi:hypothetical protein